MYELDLKNSWLSYITPTRKKYFKLALDWCLKNNWNSCKVNRIYYNFDFEKMQVGIGTNGDMIYYSIKEV